MTVLTKAASRNYQSRSMANGLVRGVTQGSFTTRAGMLVEAGRTPADFLKILMEPSYTARADMVPENLRKGGKRRSKESQITY